MKTPKEELVNLGKMLTATMPEDTMRIMSIAARITEIGRDDLKTKDK